MYDIIGDIHGHATPLKQLLTKMGYQQQGGVWQHSTRTVIFLGDFVDRGPEQLEVVQIAKSMVEANQALAVMGNHEFNAVAWATEHPEGPDGYLRKHSDKNRDQHQAFLAQVSEGSETHRELIKWFKTLPLYLELDGLRVVHACWHSKQINVLQSYLDDRNSIKPNAWPALALKEGAGYEALEVVLKGLEIELPDGATFQDKNNHTRSGIRTAWWRLDATTYKEVAMVPSSEVSKMPDTDIPVNTLPGYASDKPVFIGHYWLRDDPSPLNPYVACLDYSIAGDEGGKLCAYRWDGEKTLAKENFCWVERSV
ncbi:metallophosphoesterase [Saccharospirillum sp.]|uniref:metallophosphoesterase n=1 Tax=Saccharospirillum sp. TaxID=2033801 RepID=UPI0034A0433D